MSVEEILNKYKGFEGELIFFYKIEKNKDELIKIINQCLNLKKIENCLMLNVISNDEIMPISLKKKAIFVGYDFGLCEDGATIYSSIFNEILFGHLNQLIACKIFLNKNLLFQNKSAAEKYIDLHNKLSIEEKGVEDYFEMVIYEIWKIE